MKAVALTLIMFYMILTTPVNKPVEKVDLARFAGKWYSLYSIPTVYDKGSRETTAIYNLNKDGYYNVITEYKMDDDPEVKIRKSKLFPEEHNFGEMKAEFIWPLKADYWVIELPDDYSYVVVGHPYHKYLFIMSRKPTMDKKLYDEIVIRCKTKGYDVDKLTSQLHHG